MSFQPSEIFKLKVKIQQLEIELARYKKECHDIDDPMDFCVACEADKLHKENARLKEENKRLHLLLKDAVLVGNP